MLAQKTRRARRRVQFVIGREQISTRIYTSLLELVEGWGKNVYAGGLHGAPYGALGRALFPVALVLAPIASILPVGVLLLALGGVAPAALAWSAAATGASVLWWALVYKQLEEPVYYALLYPLGSAVLLYICARAVVRGRRVEWKGREYVTQ